MDTEMQHSCSDGCYERCQKSDGKCPTECKCAMGSHCCTGGACSTMKNSLKDSDKNCTCKTDGVCTCPKGACDCK